MRKEFYNGKTMKPFHLLILFSLVITGFLLLVTGFAVASDSDPAAADPYPDEEIHYFLNIALGAEYGNSKERLKRWEKNITLKVHGSPTDEDVTTLHRVISELNELTGFVRLILVKNAKNSNMSLYFVPGSEFEKHLSQYVRSRIGFFWAWWNSDMEISKAKILIASDKISQVERSHLIREELTQSLGLMHDSRKYKESIFYSQRTTVTEYARIDRLAIKLLYLDEVRPNMTRNEVLEVLSSIDLNNVKKELGWK